MSKKIKKSVPELRFPEFQESWEEKRLSELFSEFKSGFNITSEDISEKGAYPVFGGNGLRGYTNSFTHDGFYFLIGRQGALCGNINRVYEKAYISEHAIACKANTSSDTEWLAQRLDYYQLNRMSESSAQPGLSVKKLLRFKLVVPSKEEQEKIACFLRAVDMRLNQLRHKHELLQTYKRGVMQKLFSQQIRFKQDDGSNFPDWKKKKLGSFLQEYRERVPAKTNLPIYSSSREGLKPQKEYFADRELKNEGEYGIVPEGFFVYRHMSDDITFKFNINDTKEKIAVSKEYPVFTTQDLDSQFLLYKLNHSSDFKKFAAIQRRGGTRTRLYYKKLSAWKTFLPELEEQEKIASFLTTIDRKIIIIQQIIDELNTFKAGLLQKMFV